MKITCPQCGVSGNLPDHEIPEEGRFLSCPKCKHGFDVKKPKAAINEYLVDSCPACAYSTFGEERFGTCPKCGVFIKTFVDRQREEMARAREQQILTRKFSRDVDVPPPMPVGSSLPPTPAPAPETKSVDIGEMIENLHPVNLVGWGCALAAVIILLLGIFGLFDYFGTDYAAKLNEQNVSLGIEDKVSAFYVFMHYGLVPAIEFLYGSVLMAVAVKFLQKQAQARQALGWILWAFVAYVPAYYLVVIISHFFEPSSRSFVTYAMEFLQMIVVSALVGVPLYLLINFLEDKRIRSVVRL